MMLSNAVKKLERAGYSIRWANAIAHLSYDDAAPRLAPMSCSLWATKPGQRDIIELHRNGRDDEVATIRVKPQDDPDDPRSDYFSGSYFDTLAKALRYAGKP